MALGERLEDAPTRVGTSETDDSEFPIRCGSTAGGAVRWWRNGRRERPSRARGGDRVGGQDGGWPGTRGGWKVGRSWSVDGCLMARRVAPTRHPPRFRQRPFAFGT
jgi:hypothetical protein